MAPKRAVQIGDLFAVRAPRGALPEKTGLLGRVVSTSAIVGIRRREMMPVFAFSDDSVKMAMPVVSEPVPDVVGQAICGFTAPGTRRPSPIGAFTKVMNGAGYDAYRLADLQVSMTEPPPTDT